MAYEKITGTFASSNGSDTITYYVYKPEGEIGAVLQFGHGICECMEAYEDAIEYFCEQGILVCGNDHLGHGASVGSSDGYGYFAKEDGWLCLIHDMRSLHLLIKKEYPKLPYLLLGQSMGSFLARLYTAQYGTDLDGAIFMGTTGHVVETFFGRNFVKYLKKRKGDTYRSSFVNKVFFGDYNNRFKEEKDPWSWICQDADYRQKYVTDERYNFIPTLSAFYDMLTMIYHVDSKKCYRLLPDTLPYLLMSGTDDPVGQYGNGILGVHDRMAIAGCRNVTVKLYRGQRHVLLKEPVKEEVKKEIVHWMKQIPAKEQ